MAQSDLGKVMLTDAELTDKIVQVNGGVRFGKDADGKPGYGVTDAETGADTVIPFRSGGGSQGSETVGNCLKVGTTPSEITGTIFILPDEGETLQMIEGISILSNITSESNNTVSCSDENNLMIGDVLLSAKDTGEIGCIWIE